ncbi:uncharacterized protein LOC116349423 [Contarinia nasturtii]|uniref:uncharacterized protein LOC116349423 n=1 Tax=Contarinia nasturtii TaxID=265458 RepID=UPI0012D40E4E|nr:uncharacterized protein LOC116349423 [Contarinia nasturtii]
MNTIQSVDNQSDVSQQNQLRLLKFTLDYIMNARKFQCLKKPLKTDDPTVTTVGLAKIAENFETYTSIEEFLGDINCLVRCYSLLFAKSNQKKAAESLSERCHRDVKSIQLCADCFEYWNTSRDDYFTRVCAKPHLVVFARLNPYPYWPGKLMSIDGEIANIEFFGDHTQADVPVASCFLFSSEFADDSKHSTNIHLRNAYEELLQHIANIKAKFGTFHPSPFRAAINPEKIQQQLVKMIPGAFKVACDEQSSASVEKGESSSVAAVVVNPTNDTAPIIKAAPIVAAKQGNNDRKRQQNGTVASPTSEPKLKKEKVHILSMVTVVPGKPSVSVASVSVQEPDGVTKVGHKNVALQSATVTNTEPDHSQNPKTTMTTEQDTPGKSQKTTQTSTEIVATNTIEEVMSKCKNELVELQKKKASLTEFIAKHEENIRTLQNQMAVIIEKTPM